MVFKEVLYVLYPSFNMYTLCFLSFYCSYKYNAFMKPDTLKEVAFVRGLFIIDIYFLAYQNQKSLSEINHCHGE